MNSCIIKYSIIIIIINITIIDSSQVPFHFHYKIKEQEHFAKHVFVLHRGKISTDMRGNKRSHFSRLGELFLYRTKKTYRVCFEWTCVQIGALRRVRVAGKHTNTQMYVCNKTAAAGLLCASISVFDFASAGCCQKTGWRSDRWHWSWWRKQSLRRFHKVFQRWRWAKAAFLIWQVPKSIPPHRGRDNESFSIWSISVVQRAHLLFSSSQRFCLLFFRLWILS